MFFASASLAPSLPDFETLSEPARSTIVIRAFRWCLFLVGRILFAIGDIDVLLVARNIHPPLLNKYLEDRVRSGGRLVHGCGVRRSEPRSSFDYIHELFFVFDFISESAHERIFLSSGPHEWLTILKRFQLETLNCLFLAHRHRSRANQRFAPYKFAKTMW